MTKIDTNFSKEIKKYGAIDFELCYNCGTCTAICDLTEQSANFPRKYIRNGVLGQKDEILNSKDLWLCYACGDCSISCPRQAMPTEYMAALRRYAIASYEPTGITKLIFTNNIFSIIFTLIIATILGFFLLTIKPDEYLSRWIFKYLPFDVIHDMGIVIFGLTGISVAIGVWRMWSSLSKNKNSNHKPKENNSIFKSIQLTLNELATMNRYKNCDNEEYSFWQKKSKLVQPWFIHWSIMWGFIGLLIATTINFIFKDPETTTWWPSRILGITTGILMIYGTSMAIYYRKIKITKAYNNTQLSDSMFLFFLWLAGITGFWLMFAVFLNTDGLINHLVFIVHTIISMELVLLFAFSKFAHAFYRPIALYLFFKKR